MPATNYMCSKQIHRHCTLYYDNSNEVLWRLQQTRRRQAQSAQKNRQTKYPKTARTAGALPNIFSPGSTVVTTWRLRKQNNVLLSPLLCK